LGESNYFSITDGVFTRKISFGTLKNLITADGNELNTLRFKELGDKISASETLLKSEDGKLNAKINELGTSFGNFANTTNNTFENVNNALNGLKNRDDELLAGLDAQKSHDHDIFTSSGPNAKKGFVPPPDKVAGTTKYLREDGKWVVPPDTKLELGTTATTAAKGDHDHFFTLKEYTIDTRALDPNKYYAIRMSLPGAREFPRTRIEISGGFAPSWGTNSGNGGWWGYVIWEVTGCGWGAISDIYRRVLAIHNAGWITGSAPFKNIGQLTNPSIEFIYVRGGSTYLMRISNSVSPILCTENFSMNDQSFASPISNVSSLADIFVSGPEFTLNGNTLNINIR